MPGRPYRQSAGEAAPELSNRSEDWLSFFGRKIRSAAPRDRQTGPTTPLSTKETHSAWLFLEEHTDQLGSLSDVGSRFFHRPLIEGNIGLAVRLGGIVKQKRHRALFM